MSKNQKKEMHLCMFCGRLIEGQEDFVQTTRKTKLYMHPACYKTEQQKIRMQNEKLLEATKQELLEALAKELGFARLFKSEEDVYYELVDSKRNMPAKLALMEKQSDHDASSFHAALEIELKPEKYECAKALLAIKQYIEA